MSLLSANSITIQRGKHVILKNANFALESGKIYHLLGASGSGKSTLLWTLARLHPLVAGSLRFKKQLETEISITRWRAEIALLPQKPVLLISSGTVEENLLYPLQNFQIQKQRLKEREELLPTVEKLETLLDSVGLAEIPRQASSLSGGQEARLALIRVLLTKPAIILADEPTAGLDKAAAALVFKCLQQFCEQGGTVIFSSHTHDFDPAVRLELDGKGGLL